MVPRALVKAVLVAAAALALLSLAPRPPYIADAGSGSPVTGLTADRPHSSSPTASPSAVWGRVGFTWYTACFFTGYYLDTDDGTHYWLTPDTIVEPYAGYYVLITGTVTRDVEGCNSIDVSTIAISTPPMHLYIPSVAKDR